MARYHFNSHDGVHHRDVEGTELPNHARARAEALKSVGQTLIEEAETFDDSYSMEVTTAEGLDLYHVELVITASPAVKAER